MASLGIYNETYFRNHPEECTKEGVLYCIVLVNKITQIREAVKIGIAKGKDWRHVLKRAGGFKYHEIRIQKIVTGNLEDIYYLEAYLHELWSDYRYKTDKPFGGHTELFNIEMLPQILKSIPDHP
jgi:hypothetical protein